MDKEYILKIPKDHSFAYISGGTYVMGGERNAEDFVIKIPVCDSYKDFLR